ncbi:CxxxxCH/CxxCH domain c-type cytochrome, partial [Citrifermentans pelophilum]
MSTFTTISSGDHQRHAKDYAYACNYCHGAGYTTSAVSVATHVNKKINLDFSNTTQTTSTVYSKYSAAGFAPAKGYYGTCRTSYCHSNGQSDNAKASIYRQPKWGTTVLDCGGCHNNMATFANATSGSHYTHAYQTGNAKYTCDICHGSGYTGTSTVPRSAGSTHVNQKIDLSLTGYSKYSSTGFKPAKGYYGTCNVTNCHGSGKPTWGASVAAPVNGFPYSSNVCEKCHGQVNSNPFYSTAIPKVTANTDTQVGAHFNHLSSNGSRISHSASCKDCHVVPATVTASGHLNGVAEVTFPTGSLARGLAGTLQATYSSATHSCATTYCHGDTLASNKKATGAKLAAIVKAPRWATPFLSLNHATAPTAADCGACHGFPPRSAAHTAVAAYAAYTASQNISPASSNCSNCHKHFNANGTLTVAGLGLHINGSVEGGDCVGCHTGAVPAAAPKRIGAAGQFTAQSHHIQGRPVTTADCYQCHWEANSDGSINSSYHDQTSGKPVDLVIWNGTARPSGTTYTEGSTGTAYTANGTRAQIAKINNQCLSCHSTRNAAVAPFVTGSTTDKYSPEARLATPKAKTSILSRYSSTVTVAWSMYNFSSATGNTSRFGTNQK